MTFTEYKKLRDTAFKLVGDKAKGEQRFFAAYQGQPYWTHLLNVHNFLVNKGEEDYDLLLAAILHDIVEDSDIELNYIQEKFGEGVATKLDLVTSN